MILYCHVRCTRDCDCGKNAENSSHGCHGSWQSARMNMDMNNDGQLANTLAEAFNVVPYMSIVTFGATG